MPSARLAIVVRLDQAASLARLEEFVEERRTLIGTDVSVLLFAADGPAATKLFNDLGALAIPIEATAATPTTWPSATGTRLEGGGHPSLGEPANVSARAGE